MLDVRGFLDSFLDILKTRNMFFFVGDSSFRPDDIFGGHIDFIGRLEFLQLWNSLVFHELFYQIFVKFLSRFGVLKFSFSLFISTSNKDYLSMN